MSQQVSAGCVAIATMQIGKTALYAGKTLVIFSTVVYVYLLLLPFIALLKLLLKLVDGNKFSNQLVNHNKTIGVG